MPTDEPTYPHVHAAAEGKYVVLHLQKKTDSGAHVRYRENAPVGRELIPNLSLPKHVWAALGKPTRLVVTIAVGSAVGRTRPLFDPSPATLPKGVHDDHPAR